MSGYRSIFAPGLLRGQVAVVTGGGSGIGRCTAHELASLGAAVAIVGRKVEKLDAVQAEIASAGGVCSTHACDIREEEAVRGTVAAILQRHGRIDALVNNAGGQYSSPLASISAKGWDAVVRNNLSGGFLMARECVTQWMLAEAEGARTGQPPEAEAGRRIHGGAIVNIIADMWGGMPGMGHSGAARAGMLNFTATASLEWAPVRVNAVAPGWIASSGLDRYPPEMAASLRGLHELVPLRRLGTESEVSAAIVFLLSPAAAFVSGACLRVDGAAPNAKRIWPEVGTGGTTAPFNGFHLASTPRVLDRR
ncbi:MAG TPA: SDR family oxidoreductase [Caldimonas sp.]|jgi:citronellol/citronellal dehydrogenase|nr:SDR family oxidoreductase [Caldimonas sp.]HEX2540235.1 SDR family oxidoreductase [Caldimonas sp.]